MGKKQNVRDIRAFFGDGIVKNLLVIVAVGLCLLFLTLIFLRIYTRHNSDVIVPLLHGLQVEEARAILKSKGLHAEIVDSIYQKNAVPGAILSQVPKADNKVKKGRAIYITIYSKNPQQIAVPGLVDYSSRQALALLNSIGFAQVDIDLAPSQYAGLVLAVEYRGRTLSPDEKIPAGSPLKLIVGNGGGTIRPDSLGVDDESIVSPAEHENSTTPKKQSAQQGDLDKSFF